jgi:hypothetical protein
MQYAMYNMEYLWGLTPPPLVAPILWGGTKQRHGWESLEGHGLQCITI